MSGGPEPATPIEKRVEMTGWSAVALGAVCLLLAVLEAALPLLLRRISAALAAGDTAALEATREAFARGAGTSAAVNALFGTVLAVVGVAVARRLRWAHLAMTASAWASIAMIAVIAGPSVAPVVAMTGGGAGARAWIYVVAAVLVAAQIAAVLWFLRFWRRPDVRALFD